MNRDPNCSRCGDFQDLHLITIPYEGGSGPGRILVYCEACRETSGLAFGTSIPLDAVTTEVFLSLYRNNMTGSDPETASAIVFGEVDPTTVLKAEELMAQQE